MEIGLRPFSGFVKHLYLYILFSQRDRLQNCSPQVGSTSPEGQLVDHMATSAEVAVSAEAGLSNLDMVLPIALAVVLRSANTKLLGCKVLSSGSQTSLSDHDFVKAVLAKGGVDHFWNSLTLDEARFHIKHPQAGALGAPHQNSAEKLLGLIWLLRGEKECINAPGSSLLRSRSHTSIRIVFVPPSVSVSVSLSLSPSLSLSLVLFFPSIGVSRVANVLS